MSQQDSGKAQERVRQVYLTPPQIAKQLAVDAAKVLGWIRRGELRATNVADRAGGRPRWRIAQMWLEEFLRRREASPVPTPKKRSKRQPADWVEFV